jgi:hypothetical protein
MVANGGTSAILTQQLDRNASFATITLQNYDKGTVSNDPSKQFRSPSGVPEAYYFGGYYTKGAWYYGNSKRLADNQWINMQVTWDGKNITTYINNINIGSVESKEQFIKGTSNPFRIGRCWDNLYFIKGEIGEVRIYNYALNQTQVTDSYMSSLTTFIPIVPNVPGPLVYLNAQSSDPKSGLWKDLSGNNNNATILNGTATMNSTNNGYVLDGKTAWNFPNPKGGISNAWTISAWYKNTGEPTNSKAGSAQILTQPLDRSKSMVMMNSTQSGFWNQSFSYSTSYSLVNNVWTNIQIVYDGKNISTYINNKLLGTVPSTVTFVAGNANVYLIGKCWDQDSFMVGEIGEIRIYNYALSNNQVSNDYLMSFSKYLHSPPSIARFTNVEHFSNHSMVSYINLVGFLGIIYYSVMRLLKISPENIINNKNIELIINLLLLLCGIIGLVNY